MIKNKIIAIFLSLMLFFMYSAPVCYAATSKGRISNENDYVADVNLDWWKNFNDPLLVEYIDKAIKSNYDLKRAFLRVSASRAKVKESLGAEFPQLTLLANFIRINPPFAGENTSSGTTSGARDFQNFFTVPLFANYEVDLWRKNRKATLAEGEKLETERQSARATYILLTTEVASAYFNILSLDRLIELQQMIVNLETQNLEIIRANYGIGLAAADELFTAEKSLAEADKILTELDKQREIFINQLLVLTGQSPEAVKSPELSRNSMNKIELIEEIYDEVPSDIIMTRPDILGAEAELKNAKINVSLARKDFLPDINLFGIFGFNSNAFERVFNWENYLASVGTSLIGKLFTGGQRRARLKQRKFEYEQMLQSYQQTILTSLQEVNDSLYSLKNDLEIYKDDIDRLSFESANLNLVNIRYEKGLVSYKDTIQPQKNLILLEQDLIQSKTGYLIDSLNLYKALGGKY